LLLLHSYHWYGVRIWIAVHRRAARQGELYSSCTWRFALPSATSPQTAGNNNGASSGAVQPPLHLPFHKFRQGDGVLVSRYKPAAPAAVGSRGRSKPTSKAGAHDTKEDAKEGGGSSMQDSGHEHGSEAAAAGSTWFVEGTVLEARRTHLILTLSREVRG
jgi:hypothetical protein